MSFAAFRPVIVALCLASGALQPVSAQDVAALKSAFDLSRSEDFTGAIAAVSHDALSRDLIEWAQLREGDGTFAQAQAFIARRGTWPGMERLRTAVEPLILPETPANEVLAFFAATPPATGEGLLAYVNALNATGQTEVAALELQNGWLKIGMEQEAQDALVAAYGPQLAPFHFGRVDAMLWRWKTTDARQMLPLLDAETRAWAEARIALIDKTGDQNTKLAAVTGQYREDAALAYDLFNFLADTGERTQAVQILLSRTQDAAHLIQPFRWASWRRILARWEMREGRPDQAYTLASKHHLTPDDGENYADLEWLAGYLSLTYLNNPQQALTHFRTMQAAVDSPISDGRAGYWIGRALEKLGDTAGATAAYTEGAAHQTGFYGLLSAEKLGMSLDPTLTGAETFPAFASTTLPQDERVRAAFALLDVDQRGLAFLFFAQLGQQLERSDLGSLGDEMARRNEPYVEVLLGKSAAARGIILPSIYFPLHEMYQMDLPVPTALALSIARRESEFNAVVGSSVGALGLMQLMPGTAEEVAGELGLPYSRGRLTADWRYNATLGSRYLANLQEKFGYTPVMIAAGYNAGPSRPEQWNFERGDPRLGAVDVVDWIEHIPFRETRNYVQRVTESIPIYEARLTGQTGPIQFTRLLVGDKPLIRPQVRPSAETVALPSGTVSVEASELAPTVSLRPTARP